jgi:demethylmenaquinone methyltransferase/2-methoxy-6-polyprenyl-1,4-benzoquinol methylase
MRDPGRIREMFGEISGRYDLLNRLLSAGRDRAWRRATVDRLAPEPGERALDLCGGTGDLALDLAEEGASVVCADFSWPMLLGARPKLAGRRAGPVRLLLADALRLPFAEGSFDLATMAFGLRNLRTVGEGLSEMRRVLRPGGRLGILEFSRPPGRVLRGAYHLYLGRILPAVGGWVSGRPKAYRYLADSIRGFPDQEGLAREMAEAGLEGVTYRNLSGGIVALHTARRPV